MLNRRLTYQDFFVLGVQPGKKDTVVEKKRYRYYYDSLNRITIATDNTNNYSLGSTTNPVTYDKNGNIMSLYRKGHTNVGATNFGVMDDLTYSYDNGNKLMKVADAAPIDQFGFKDDAVGTADDDEDDYSYDHNGNLLTDTNKGITSVLYNHLNMPTEIKFNNSDTKKINYTYDATGVKLRKVVNDGGAITTLDYAGNGAVYENNTLQFIPHPEGYITPDGSGGFDYIYQYLDHLGSIRLSYTDADGNGTISQSEIIQENNYYAFGLKHKGYNNVITSTNPAQDFKYNGKELQDELDLNWYDLGARNYDHSLGRFMNIDPKAEQYSFQSTYAFANNNSIYYVDINGEGVDTDYKLDKKKGEITRVDVNDGSEKNKNDRLYATDDDGNVDKNKKIQIDKENAEDNTLISDVAESTRTYNTENSEGVKSEWKKTLTTTSSKEDAFKVFNFVANNSNVEWSLHKFNVSNANVDLYQIGSFHNPGVSPAFEFSNIGEWRGMIHSHPTSITLKERLSGLPYDSGVAVDYQKRYGKYPYYVYFPSIKKASSIKWVKDAVGSDKVRKTHNISNYKF